MRRSTRTLMIVLACAVGASTGAAQTTPAPTASAKPAGRPAARKKTAATKPAGPKRDYYQSPLATIMSSHLKADVPEAQDFVRESRPAAKDLKYTPLQSQLGADPVRPKPRDAANVMALQAEMEASIAHNESRAGHAKVKPHRAKADTDEN